MKRSAVLLVAAFVTLALVGCGETEKRNKSNIDKYGVFVTIHPLESIAQAIAGDRADVHTLLPPGSDPHTYEPLPNDVQKLADSAILFQIGLGLDDWAVDIALKAKDGPRIVPVSIGVPVLPALPKRLRKRYLEENKIAKHGNPHVWMDPMVMSELIIPNMTKAFIAADPKGEDYYRANSAKIKEELATFIEKTKEGVAHLKGKSVILHHGSVVYFCRQFGIVVMDVLEPLPGQEPTAKDLQEIIDEGREVNPVAILAEPQVSRKPAEVISEELEIPIIEVDPLGKTTESYIEMMERNVNAIAGIEIE